MVKNLPAKVPGSVRFSEEGNGNPLQYSCPENPMDRRAWRATVQSWSNLSKSINKGYSIGLLRRI